MKKKFPPFCNETEESEFWVHHDSTEYLDWSKSIKMTFPKLRHSRASSCGELPVSMIVNFKGKPREKSDE